MFIWLLVFDIQLLTIRSASANIKGFHFTNVHGQFLHLLGVKSHRVARDDEGATGRGAAAFLALRQLHVEDVELQSLGNILAWTDGKMGISWGYVNVYTVYPPEMTSIAIENGHL